MILHVSKKKNDMNKFVAFASSGELKRLGPH